LTLVVAFGISQLLAPGLGDRWFGNDYLPAGWLGDQGRPYYLTQIAVLGVMIVIAALFRIVGRVRSRVVAPQEISEELAEDALSAEPVELAPESDKK
jgi:hypothetical protein